MMFKRFGTITATAITGTLLLTACNGADGAADANVSHPAAGATQHGGATQAAGAIGRYTENAPGATYFTSILTGDNEVPVKGKPAVGDKNGSAVALMRVQGDEVSFAFAWTGIGTPTMAHLHQGARGTNGDVKIPFFMEKLKSGTQFVFGTVKVKDTDLLRNIKAHPDQFYFNLHTAEFPGGAVRGQAVALPGAVSLPAAIRHSALAGVVKGAQIYACTKQDDGSYAFTQDNVDATLQGGIQHSFAKHGPAGPPQWIAPDGSSVTGTVLNKFDNGTGNIPQLLLRAKQTGKSEGLLSKTTSVLRLNTAGGVAPAGTCNPAAQPTVRVPYTADYLFLATK
ncbi:CHRD domain-containing protein [Streptomyces sp. NBC_00988]|uniref:CHRD domain-containing protein n=1 Tax=Streptomyces sp. NBC_00988 TaxID=2903704 RepID=UPI00386FEB51|nr:CHRD domain-containing protein [Streptomyces sp. NBC_00988]